MRFMLSAIVLALCAVAAVAAPALTINASATPLEGSIPLQVTFSCTASAPNAKFTWTFGDGKAASIPNTPHVYERVGNFVARVEAVAGGQTASWKTNIRAALKKSVTVSGGGGAAEIAFVARKGQTIRIRMQGSSASMEPYGSLEPDGGTANYRPANDTARNGANTWQGALEADGRWTLTVFDGANQGGTVEVTIDEP